MMYNNSFLFTVISYNQVEEGIMNSIQNDINSDFAQGGLRS